MSSDEEIRIGDGARLKGGSSRDREWMTVAELFEPREHQPVRMVGVVWIDANGAMQSRILDPRALTFKSQVERAQNARYELQELRTKLIEFGEFVLMATEQGDIALAEKVGGEMCDFVKAMAQEKRDFMKGRLTSPGSDAEPTNENRPAG